MPHPVSASSRQKTKSSSWRQETQQLLWAIIQDEADYKLLKRFPFALESRITKSRARTAETNEAIENY